jgi:DNA-binding NtrC family response regulator
MFIKRHYQKELMTEKYRILIVDDDSALRDTLGSELSNAGYITKTASDGDEAIASIGKEKFDLVILDIKMPKVDGFEVLKIIKQNFQSIKVIMLTGYSDITQAIKSKKLGADDFVSKPYDLEDLSFSIERALNN